MTPKLSILHSFALIIHITNCQFQTWMGDWSGMNAATFGFDISNSTIFDIVFPGANNAGMSFEDGTTSITLSPSDGDAYKRQINTFNTDDQRIAWSERQQNSVLKLLKSGVRFLDLRFQCVDQGGNGDTNDFVFYAYNGILGRDAKSVCYAICFVQGYCIPIYIYIYIYTL